MARPLTGTTGVILAAALFCHTPLIGQVRPQTRNETQSQSFQNHITTVSRGGEAYAKPDLGILLMSIRSTSPIADEAVAENGRKAKDVEAGLAGLGFSSDRYKISSVTFGRGGGAPFPPNQSQITAYEANQTVYVFFQGAELNDMAQLTQKSAAVIEAQRKAGAVPATAGNFFSPATTVQNALIVYTIKDSEPYEKQALQQAISRARDAAQDIAKESGVALGNLRAVNSSFLYGNSYGPRSGGVALEGLKYRWYSTKSDEIEIGASATVDYEFK